MQIQNVGVQQHHYSIYKSIMTDTHISENEQLRHAIPNESKNLTPLQMSYHHQDVSICDPSMLNLSLPSPLIDENNTNIQNTIKVRLILIYNYF